MIMQQCWNDTYVWKLKLSYFLRRQKEAWPSESNKRPITEITEYLILTATMATKRVLKDTDNKRASPRTKDAICKSLPGTTRIALHTATQISLHGHASNTQGRTSPHILGPFERLKRLFEFWSGDQRFPAFIQALILRPRNPLKKGSTRSG
jgi:hypothetical protein